MDKEVMKYRNALKELFKKYGIHRAIRSNTLNDLVDELNAYYTDGTGENFYVTSKFHEEHLREQLNGWIEYLETEKDKLPKGESDYHKGVKNGFAKVIEKLKEVAER